MGQVSEHLLEFAKAEGISKHKFEVMCKMSNGLLPKISDRMGPEMRKNIQEAFPQLNMNWVFTGEGAMKLETPITIAVENNNGIVGYSNNDCTVYNGEAEKKETDKEDDDTVLSIKADDSEEVIQLKTKLAVKEAEIEKLKEFIETLKGFIMQTR